MLRARFAVMATVLVLAGCGSAAATSSTPSSHAPSVSSTAIAVPTPTSSPAESVADGYAAAGAPAATAYETWHSDLTAPGLGASGLLALAPQAATYAGQLASFDSQISALHATGQAGTDIATLITDDNAVIADLDALARQTTSTVVAWGAKGIADGETALAADNKVRADLGLPSVS